MNHPEHDIGETDPVPVSEAEATEPPSPPPPVARPRTAVRLLAAASVLGLAAAITFGLLWYRERSANRTEDDIRRVGGAFATELVTFDYRRLEQDIEEIQRYATGTFERQFATAIGGDVTVFRDAIREAQASSEGTLHGVVVRSVGDDSATAIAVIGQTIRNRESPEPRTQLQVLELTLVETPRGWRVDNVSSVGT